MVKHCLTTTLMGGALAGGRRNGRIEAWYRADFISLDQKHLVLLHRTGDAWLDGWVLTGGANVVTDFCYED